LLPEFWKIFPSKTRRVLLAAIFFFLAFSVTLVATLTPLGHEEANDLHNDLEQLRENVSIQMIFGNNLMICLIMFVPVIGPAFGFYALYNTGVVIAAEGLIAGVSPPLVFIMLFLFPFTWLEFIAYSTALSESVLLFWRLIHGKGRKEIVNASILITFCVILLLLGAIVEMALISLSA